MDDLKLIDLHEDRVLTKEFGYTEIAEIVSSVQITVTVTVGGNLLRKIMMSYTLENFGNYAFTIILW